MHGLAYTGPCMIYKLTVPRRLESLNRLLNMHRMARHAYNKRWEKDIREASYSSLTGHESLIKTISQAEESLCSTLSAMSAT